MKKIITIALFSAAAVLGGMGGASASSSVSPVANACMNWTVYTDATCGCVASDAKTKLSTGQYAYLVGLVDGDKDTSRYFRDYELTPGQAMKVHGFAWTAGTRCVMAN